MAEIIDFLVSNSAWILIFVIVILLSIVGSYAEKTNFGFGNKLLDSNSESNDEKEVDLSKKRLGDILEIKKDESSKKETEENFNQSNLKLNENLKSDETIIYNNATNVGNSINDNIKEDVNIDESQSNAINDIQNINKIGNVEFNSENTLEEKLKKLDDEFYQVIPKKEIIDEDILDSIDDILFNDKKDEYIYSQSFEDIELPKIKPLKDEEIDIWKF